MKKRNICENTVIFPGEITSYSFDDCDIYGYSFVNSHKADNSFSGFKVKDENKINIICKNNFILAVGKFLYVNECKQRNIKYYYTFPVNTLYELKALEDAGCEYALIDAPLTHMLPTIKEKYSIK